LASSETKLFTRRSVDVIVITNQDSTLSMLLTHKVNDFWNIFVHSSTQRFIERLALLELSCDADTFF
jgi:hypothetical protein